MAYQKQTWREYDDTKTELQNALNGALATPERLNHIENGIANSADKAEVTAQLADIVLDVKRFGAHEITEPGYENFDSSVAIQAAHDSQEKGFVYISGNFKVGKTIVYKKPMRGATKNKSVLTSIIKDGSPVILIDNTDYWELSDMLIDGDFNNCEGLKVINTSSWYNIFNVDVRKCLKGGFDIEGWGGVIEDCHAIDNGVYGWTLKQANGVKANIQADRNDGVGVIVESCAGLNLLSLLSEGNSNGGLLINGGKNITINSLYLESNFKYQLKAGFGEKTVVNLNILGGNIYNAENGNESAVQLDNVKFATIQCEIDDYISKQPIITTEKTRNIELKGGFLNPVTSVKDYGNKLYKRKINFMPNPYFDHWLAGYKGISPSNANYVEEKILVRNGVRSIKIVNKDGGSISRLSLEIDNNIVDLLKGKKITLGAWVYIPSDIDAMPTLTVQGLKSGSLTSLGGYLTPGGWNFITTDNTMGSLTIASDETSIVVWLNNQSTVQNSYIIVDSIVLTEYESASIYDLLKMEFKGASQCPIIENGNITLFKDEIPESAFPNYNNIYKKGDKIINANPMTGGYVGWVCINDSVKGVNVGSWKGYGLIE